MMAVEGTVYPFRHDVPNGKEGDGWHQAQLRHQDEPVGKENTKDTRQERNQVRRAAAVPMLGQRGEQQEIHSVDRERPCGQHEVEGRPGERRDAARRMWHLWVASHRQEQIEYAEAEEPGQEGTKTGW